MRTFRTVSLELLRHGPPHNQLLSPLTPYLALCGNHGAQTVYLPFEHREFLLRMRALRYRDQTPEADEVRSAHVREVSQLLGHLLGNIPGLAAELGASTVEPEGLVHLQVVTSAAELALLPFEAALVPRGAPGEGSPLALQTELPVCITRQSRRSTPERVEWPSQPRILLAIAEPGSLEVPGKAHEDLLREAIKHWVRPAPQGKTGDNQDELLTVLRNASLSDLHEACTSREYTHVHILAHGKSLSGPGGERFGIALHDDTDTQRERVVSGEQLATALRGHMKTVEGRLSHPTVVTIASCDSANVGSVVEPGGSLAHALHEAGIPLVIASQYPLTFEGSEVLARELYPPLLWGMDPRVALHGIRQQLRLQEECVHDWASLVTYASFPTDFDAQLRRAQMRSAIDAASATLRRTERKLGSEGASPEVLQEAQRELEMVKRRLERASPVEQDASSREARAEIQGLCGSIDKQLAQLIDQGLPVAKGGPSLEERRALLARARQHYRQGLLEKLHSHWHATQYLSLCAILDGKLSRRWYAYACQVARFPRDTGSREERIWALGSLAELKMLSIYLPEALESEGDARAAVKAKAATNARSYVRKLLGLTEPGSFYVFSTRRQFERYVTWWAALRPDLAEVARQVLEELQDVSTQPPAGSPPLDAQPDLPPEERKK